MQNLSPAALIFVFGTQIAAAFGTVVWLWNAPDSFDRYGWVVMVGVCLCVLLVNMFTVAHANPEVD